MKDRGRCPHCGAEIARGTGVKQYYCLNCGAALDEERKRKEATARGRPRRVQAVEESTPSTSSGKLFSGLRESVRDKTKEQDSYHLVIKPSLLQRVVVLLFLGFFILGAGIVIPVVISTGEAGFALVSLILPIVVLLYIAGRLIGKKLVLDKLAQNITVEERQFMVIPKRHVIPFSAVTSVNVEYKRKLNTSGHGSLFYDAWQVSLDIGGERIKVDHQEKQENMYRLADKVARFIDKEVVIKSYKPHMPPWQDYPRRF